MDNLNLSDDHLIQIVDAALADVTRRSGRHLACRPGCSQCCTGSFAINALDVQRLREGFLRLERAEPQRAQDLKTRITASIHGQASQFPGDTKSGVLGKSLDEQKLFAEFANEETCPVLDPATQTCDLYASRPMTCRVFGPPVRNEIVTSGSTSDGALSVCELCFVDATHDEITACEMVPDPDHLESRLLASRLSEGQQGLFK